MEKLLEALPSALSQVPQMAVLVIVVYLFLQYMKSQRQEFVNMIAELHEDHMQARTASREAMLIQIETMGKLGEKIGELATSIDTLTKHNGNTP